MKETSETFDKLYLRGDNYSSLSEDRLSNRLEGLSFKIKRLANIHLSHFESAQFNGTCVSVEGSWFCFGIFLGKLSTNQKLVSHQPAPSNDGGGGVFIVGNPKELNNMFDPKWSLDTCPQWSDLSSSRNFTCGTSKADSQTEFCFEGRKYEAFSIET